MPQSRYTAGNLCAEQNNPVTLTDLIRPDGPTSMLEPLKAMETEPGELEAQLEGLDAVARVTELHPQAATAYAWLIGDLGVALAAGPSGPDALPAAELAAAIGAVRQLITRITVSRNAKSGEAGLHVEGDLAALMAASEGSQIKVGAGVGFEPTTFRL